MSDMRLIVAGAGGRMGRTLIHAIVAMDGAVLDAADAAPADAWESFAGTLTGTVTSEGAPVAGAEVRFAIHQWN